MTTHPVILTINSGSSSIKFSLFSDDEICTNLYYGNIDIHTDNKQSILRIFDAKHNKLKDEVIQSIEYTTLFHTIINWIDTVAKLVSVGHRVVHGGQYFTQPVIINETIIKQIEELIPLAPLHQIHNVEAIKIIAKQYPHIKQCACFDTSFHITQFYLAKLFALPRDLIDAGIIRYGFHGLSYEYIASVLPKYIGEIGHKKVIVQHLGSGSSVCALNNGKSVATSMGFTALDGLMMGSRCGSLDPGVILYLLQEKKYSAEYISKILYHDSGLLGVSNGISSDMRELITSNNKYAIEAIELFCYRVACEIGSLSVSLGGCDAIVFTAGIGEHIPIIRQKICAYLEFLGIKLDPIKNDRNEIIISDSSSSIIVSVIPTNEEYMIAHHTRSILQSKL